MLRRSYTSAAAAHTHGRPRGGTRDPRRCNGHPRPLPGAARRAAPLSANACPIPLVARARLPQAACCAVQGVGHDVSPCSGLPGAALGSGGAWPVGPFTSGCVSTHASYSTPGARWALASGLPVVHDVLCSGECSSGSLARPSPAPSCSELGASQPLFWEKRRQARTVEMTQTDSEAHMPTRFALS